MTMGISTNDSHRHWNLPIALLYEGRSSEARMRRFTPSEKAYILNLSGFPLLRSVSSLLAFFDCSLILPCSWRWGEIVIMTFFSTSVLCVDVSMCVRTYAYRGKRGVLVFPPWLSTLYLETWWLTDISLTFTDQQATGILHSSLCQYYN